MTLPQPSSSGTTKSRPDSALAVKVRQVRGTTNQQLAQRQVRPSTEGESPGLGEGRDRRERPPF